MDLKDVIQSPTADLIMLEVLDQSWVSVDILFIDQGIYIYFFIYNTDMFIK